MDQRSMPQRPSPATPTVGCRHRRRFCRGEAITCHKNTHTRVKPHTEAQPWPVDSSTGHPAGHRSQAPMTTGHKDHRSHVTVPLPGPRPLLGRVNHLATRRRVTLPPCETEASQSQQFKIRLKTSSNPRPQSPFWWSNTPPTLRLKTHPPPPHRTNRK